MVKKHDTIVLWQLTWSKWVLLATIFLAPLYASTAHWYPFTTPKTLLIIGGVSISAILYLWVLLRDSTQTFRITYLHYIALGFLATLSLSSALGANPHQSFFGTFYSSTSMVLLIALFAGASLIGEFIRRDEHFVHKLLNAVFWSGVITAFVTYLPHTNSSWQLLAISGGAGFLGNSSFTGGFLLFVVAAGLYKVFTIPLWRTRAWYVVGSLIVGLCPMFINPQVWNGSVGSALDIVGQAQGAFLGIVVMGVAALALMLMISKRKSSVVVGAVLGVCLVGALTLGYQQLFVPTSGIHQKFIALKTGTRFIFWDIAKQSIKERPILGWGFENYQTLYQDRFNPIIYNEGYVYEQWVTNPHNVLFDMGVSGGILGLLMYLVLLGAVGWQSFKSARYGETIQRKALLILPALLLGYLVQNLFIFDTPVTWLMYFVVIGIAFGLVQKGREVACTTPLTRSLARTKIAVLIIVYVVCVLLPAHESRMWGAVLDTQFSDERIALQERVQRISWMGSIDDDIVYAQKTMVALAARRAMLTPEQKGLYLKQIDSLVGMLDRDAHRYPTNFYVRYLAGSFTHLAYSVDPTRGVASLDAARAYFSAALANSPRNPKVYYNLAQNALFRKDKTTAVALVKQGMAIGASVDGEELLKRIGQ